MVTTINNCVSRRNRVSYQVPSTSLLIALVGDTTYPRVSHDSEYLEIKKKLNTQITGFTKSLAQQLLASNSSVRVWSNILPASLPHSVLRPSGIPTHEIN